MGSNIKLLAFLMIAAATVAFSAGISYSQQSRSIQGTLYEVATPCTDCPRYAVILDQPVMVGMTVLNDVELNPVDTDVSGMVGSKVNAIGTFVQWRTKQRGAFIVLNVCEINTIK